MKIKNLWKALIDQGPPLRFIKNFVLSKTGWGLFHQNAHISWRSGKPKVKYNTKPTAIKAAASMQTKTGNYFSNYKCVYCDGYHIGKNNNRARSSAG